MDLTQIQIEAIDAAHSEGSVDPTSFAKILRLDPDAVTEAVAGLVGRGFMEQDADGLFALTEDGERVHRQREAQASAAVKRATPTWPPR